MLINTQISDSRFGRRLLAATLQLVLLISLLISAPSQAWWDMGHAAVCDAAQGQLSPSARAVLDDLLQGERFGSACSWADRIKKKRPESRSWHYLNVDRDTSSVRLVTPPEDGDIITALKRYRAVLANAAAPRSDRAEALRFVAHFVADIHQPLHIGLAEDWGGTATLWRSQKPGSIFLAKTTETAPASIRFGTATCHFMPLLLSSNHCWRSPKRQCPPVRALILLNGPMKVCA